MPPARPDGPVSLRAEVSDLFTEIEHRLRHNGAPDGVPTGFRRVDEALRGLRPGHLTVLAGERGAGKTALMNTLVIGAASAPAQGEQGAETERVAPAKAHGVLLASLATKRAAVTARLLLCGTSVPRKRFHAVHLHASDWMALTRSANERAAAAIWLHDPSDVSLSALREAVRAAAAAAAEGPAAVALVVIDDADLLAAPDPRVPRAEQVDAVGRELKRLALELDVAVLAVTQPDPGARLDDPATLASPAALAAAIGLARHADAALVLRPHAQPAPAGPSDDPLEPDTPARHRALDLVVQGGWHGSPCAVRLLHDLRLDSVRESHLERRGARSPG